MINDILREKSFSKYRLSKLSSVPYTTINDICSGKADIRKCSVDTVYKIATVFGVTVEELHRRVIKQKKTRSAMRYLNS